MYNGRPQAVCEPTLLQKDPRCSLETAVPSSREATARARAPRPNRRWETRCTPRLHQATVSMDLAWWLVLGTENRKCQQIERNVMLAWL